MRKALEQFFDVWDKELILEDGSKIPAVWIATAKKEEGVELKNVVVELRYQLNKIQILEALHEGVVEVVFQKVDGTTRTMECTLNVDKIKEADVNYVVEPPSNKPKTEKQENAIRVYSIKDLGWRSFRADSIISWTKL